MVIGGSVVGYRPAVLYAGPGDVVSGAVAWWGLRAYSAATIGNNAVRLRRDSDNAEQDFVTIAGGGLDLTAINSFKSAANLFVVTMYDQSGNSRNITQATAGNQPGFTTSAPTTGLPAIDMSTTAGYLASSAITLATPLTYVAVARTSNSFQVLMINQTSGVTQLRHNPGTANQWDIVGSVGVANTGATDNVWHTGIGVFNGASSDIVIDGVSATGNTGTAGFSAEPFGALAAAAGSVSWAGYCAEIAIWPIAFDASQKTNINANTNDYWGF